MPSDEYTEPDLDATRLDASPLAPSGDDEGLHTGPVLIRGAQVGRYLIIDSLGVGGMGEVFSAYDPQLDRRIALKLVKFGLNENSDNAKDRLLREAQALAKLSHPNVVAVYDAGTHGSKVFIAMEYVEGHTMKDWLALRAEHDVIPGRWPEALDLMLQAGRGLAAAHAQDLVHRDFKPANVMVSEDGRVRVLDFGLARQFGELDREEERNSGPISVDHLVESLDGVSGARSSLRMQLTQTGMVMGTPAYMAPEQFYGGFIDERTDQFSFCVVLFRALFSIRPFAGENFQELGRSVAKGQLREMPKSAKVPKEIQAALRKGLSVSRDERHPSMSALLDELERSTGQNRRRALWAGGAVALAASIGGAAVALGASDPSGPPPCEGSEARLDGIWDDDRRVAMASAFKATELPYAEDARAATERSLDEYTEQWVQLHTEVCEATRVHADQSEVLMDLRIGCLNERLRYVNALTALLADADADVVKNAALGVQQLPSPTNCTTVDREDSGLLRPDDPELIGRVEQVRESIAEARARAMSGKYKDGLVRATTALELARELDYAPARAEAAVVAAQIHERQVEPKKARDTYREALYAAAESGHTRIEAEALIGLLSVAGMHMSDPETALRHGIHAAAVVKHMGNPPAMRAALALYRGNTYMAATQLELALEQFRRAVELSEGVISAERIRIAALNNEAAVQGQQGYYRNAAEAFAEATQLAEARLGPWHPVVGNHYNNLGVTYSRLDESQLAMTNVKRALQIYERVLTPDHPEIGRAYHNLGVVQLSFGDIDDAYASSVKALEIKTRGLGPDHPSVAISANNVGDSLIRQGRSTEAIPYIEDALRIWTAANGEDSPLNINGLVSLSEAYLALEQPTRAVPPIRRALKLGETGEVDPLNMAKAEFVAARAIWGAARDKNNVKAEALALAQGARTRYERSDRPSPTDIAEIDAWLARPR